MLQTHATTRKTSLTALFWSLLRAEAASSLHSNHFSGRESLLFSYKLPSSSLIHHPQRKPFHSSTFRRTPSLDCSTPNHPSNLNSSRQHSGIRPNNRQNFRKSKQKITNKESSNQPSTNISSTFESILPDTGSRHPKIPKEHEKPRTKELKYTAPSAEESPVGRHMLKKKLEPWTVQKAALKKKFQGGWNPPKRLSPDALDGIRHLHATAPDKFTTPVLAQHFEVSPEAIRRILKSKWRPSKAEREKRRERWDRRRDRIWTHMSELGLRPHRKSLEPISDIRILDD